MPVHNMALLYPLHHPPNIVSLDVSENHFYGSFPKLTSSVKSIFAHDNGFIGDFDEIFSSVLNMIVILMHDNSFSDNDRIEIHSVQNKEGELKNMTQGNTMM